MSILINSHRVVSFFHRVHTELPLAHIQRRWREHRDDQFCALKRQKMFKLVCKSPVTASAEMLLNSLKNITNFFLRKPYNVSIIKPCAVKMKWILFSLCAHDLIWRLIQRRILRNIIPIIGRPWQHKIANGLNWTVIKVIELKCV